MQPTKVLVLRFKKIEHGWIKKILDVSKTDPVILIRKIDCNTFDQIEQTYPEIASDGHTFHTLKWTIFMAKTAIRTGSIIEIDDFGAEYVIPYRE